MNWNLLSRQLSSPKSTRLFQHAFLSTSSQSHLVINAVGNDRLGIVSDVTKFVVDAGGNVGESQAARLGSHFSLMMLVQIPSDAKEALKSNLKSMTDMDTSIFETSAVRAAEATPEIGYSGVFSVGGADNLGIVHQVTSFLAKKGLNIDKMETVDEIAPHGGTVLFKMKGVATAGAPLAAGFDVDGIKQELSSLGDSLNCDIAMKDKVDD